MNDEIVFPVHPSDVERYGAPAILDAVARALAAQHIPPSAPVRIFVTDKPVTDAAQLDFAQVVHALLHKQRCAS